ncbi:ankyrin repeat and KH domain-containing protein mask-1-like [Lineus longissimus]|uniref:ankyrin repeat and KH domain-containing protein mask-1-like n=1 Tax=Lineus longissimus TaxID=88925 RepID=UPI00315D3A6F
MAVSRSPCTEKDGQKRSSVCQVDAETDEDIISEALFESATFSKEPISCRANRIGQMLSEQFGKLEKKSRSQVHGDLTSRIALTERCIRDSLIERLAEHSGGLRQRMHLDELENCMITALRVNDKRLMVRLLNLGASPDKAGDINLLVFACRKGRKSAVEILVNHGANVNIEPKYTKFWGTPLIAAVMQDDLDMVNILLDKGADVNQLMGNPFFAGAASALMQACEYGRYRIVDELLSRGADVRQTNCEGMGVIHITILGRLNKDTIRIVDLLLLNDADVNSQYFNGRTPLDETLLRLAAEENKPHQCGHSVPILTRIACRLIGAGGTLRSISLQSYLMPLCRRLCSWMVPLQPCLVELVRTYIKAGLMTWSEIRSLHLQVRGTDLILIEQYLEKFLRCGYYTLQEIARIQLRRGMGGGNIGSHTIQLPRHLVDYVLLKDI